MTPSGKTLELLERAHRGDHDAQQQLFLLCYEELHTLAHRARSARPRSDTLQTTALLDDVYLKLFRNAVPAWKDRAHFMATAARAMRQLIIDHVRTKSRERRLPEARRVPLDELVEVFEARAGDLVVVNDAINALEHDDPMLARCFILSFFGGFSVAEIADIERISLRATERLLRKARSYLRWELGS